MTREDVKTILKESLSISTKTSRWDYYSNDILVETELWLDGEVISSTSFVIEKD